MAAHKRKPSGSRRKGAAKKGARRSTLQKQMVQDVYVGPSVKQIERSFDLGKSETLASFRTKVGW